METKLSSSHQAPDFDAKIADWIDAFEHDQWGGVIRVFGICTTIDGAEVIYRSIEANGMQEVVPLLEFLHFIGLRDRNVNIRGIDAVYGLPLV